eukprot:Seg202.4 transcript_id=Seg202.4/GoldUCD/mRNA.D3Y31 product="Cyclin-D-binding Myb-like transcription factor 1" protein_id=Seg202.4/GoldUCD/D3Y31
MNFEEITAKGEHKNCKVSKHKKKKRKQKDAINKAAVVKECAESFCEVNQSNPDAKKKSKKRRKHSSADDGGHCEQSKDMTTKGTKENCDRKIEESECLPQMGIDFDAVGADEIQSLPTSQIRKKQRKAKKHKKKTLETHDSQVEKVSKLCTRTEECGDPTRLTGDQDKPKKCKKETHNLGGKICQQHHDLLKTNVKECDDKNVNFTGTRPNFIGSSINIDENKCHEKLIANQNEAIMNHKHKKKKKKRSRDVEDRVMPRGQIHLNKSERQKMMSDNFKDIASVAEMKQDQLVEAKFTENDGKHKCKKKRRNVDLFSSPAGKIVEIKDVETLNQKMHVAKPHPHTSKKSKPHKQEIKEKTNNGLSCEEQVIDQKEHTVRSLEKDCDQTIAVNQHDTETNFVRKRKKKKRKHQSNDLEEGHTVDAAYVGLKTSKLYEKQVNERENNSSRCYKRIKIECMNDLECDEKKNIGSDTVEARTLRSTNVQGKLASVDCRKRDIKRGTDKLNENRTSVVSTDHGAENDLGSGNDQADFIFPNVHGSDGDGLGSSESEGEDNIALEHSTLFALIADNDDQSDSWKARDASDSKGDNAEEDASPGKLSHQLKINKQAIKNKLQGLDHDLRFKWTLKPADIEQLSRQGIQFEEGIWTKEEIEILESNMTEFCDTAGMSLQDLKNLLLDKSATGRKIKKELGIYTFLTVGLNRNIFNVYDKIVKSIDPCSHKGKWSNEEENNLLELFRKYGCRWSKIGSEIGRSRSIVALKVNGLLNGDLHKGFDNVVPSIQGPWKADEEDRLLKVVKEFSAKTECNGDEESGKEKPICWVTVAAHVNTRTSRQCRTKWFNDLSWKKPGQKKRMWPKEDFAKFLTLLNDCGEKYEKHVDWVKIGKDLEMPESGTVLRTKWLYFKKQVPGYKLLDFQEILDWLMKNKVPKLLGRSD